MRKIIETRNIFSITILFLLLLLGGERGEKIKNYGPSLFDSYLPVHKFFRQFVYHFQKNPFNKGCGTDKFLKNSCLGTFCRDMCIQTRLKYVASTSQWVLNSDLPPIDSQCVPSLGKIHPLAQTLKRGQLTTAPWRICVFLDNILQAGNLPLESTLIFFFFL